MKLRPLLAAVWCAAFLVGGSSAFGQSDAQFAKANQDYAQSHYKEAIDGYEGLVRSGEWSAALFYDLGNAYFRTGDFGRAILNYERALALDRQHPESTANLRIARDEARALEMQPTWLERHVRFAGLNQYSIAAAVSFWVWIFCIARLIFVRNRRPTGAIALSILAFAVFATTLFAIYRVDSETKNLAIVTGNEVIARLATSDNAGSVLALPAGSEIRILSRRGDWTYVVLPNDQRGWIPAKGADQVRL